MDLKPDKGKYFECGNVPEVAKYKSETDVGRYY
jgi:hypothetical protein